MPKLFNSYFNIIKKYLPEKKLEFSVGLDIGNNFCKWVELIPSANSYEIIGAGSIPFANNDPAAALKSLKDKIQKPNEPLFAAVSGKGTLIRYIEMPRMSHTELMGAFLIEADKYFPFNTDQIYFDCHILDPKEKTKQMSVMAAAVRKEMVDQRLTVFKNAGLQPQLIGLNPIALANAYFVLDPDNPEMRDKAVAILDIGDVTSTLIISVNKMPRFTRDIFIGGKELTKRISNALGVSLEEAEKLKCQSAERRQEIISACESTLMNIVQEIRISFDYFLTERNVELGQILLTGGGALLEGMAQFISSNLELKVELWDPVKRLKISSKVSGEEIKKQNLQLSVALGLALYCYDHN
jgi:type IV pilus assembly protein PilM